MARRAPAVKAASVRLWRSRAACRGIQMHFKAARCKYVAFVSQVTIGDGTEAKLGSVLSKPEPKLADALGEEVFAKGAISRARARRTTSSTSLPTAR